MNKHRYLKVYDIFSITKYTHHWEQERSRDWRSLNPKRPPKYLYIQPAPGRVETRTMPTKWASTTYKRDFYHPISDNAGILILESTIRSSTEEVIMRRFILVTTPFWFEEFQGLFKPGKYPGLWKALCEANSAFSKWIPPKVEGPTLDELWSDVEAFMK